MLNFKRETNRFYLKIKAVCTPEQLEKLQDAFSPLFRNEPQSGNGQGRQGRSRGNGTETDFEINK